MAINFDALPSGKPSGSLIPKGTYYATIDDAQMKQGLDPSKPEYLNVKYKLKTKEGTDAGILYDIISESEHQLMQYKLKRFLYATEISFTGEFELKDLQKVIKGKEIILDTMINDKQEPARATVDLFTNEIYYRLSEAKEIFNLEDKKTSVINAKDSADADEATDDDESSSF
jgi:hypothetical protein